MDNYQIKRRVGQFRKSGKTYSEIQKIMRTKIPKSTLSYWCRKIKLPKWYILKVKKLNKKNLRKAQERAWLANREKREKFLKAIDQKNRYLVNLLSNKGVCKISLAMLYLAEGSKSTRGSLMFGNSDPLTVGLFMKFLRYCYVVDEGKLRCTLQCRADQNIRKLEKFWSEITKIPLTQFYKARVDPRTIGKPSKKLDYKGVCRIDYFSADVDTELKRIVKIIE
jgi:hypothetical protein